MPLQKIVFKPGVNRENTRYTTEGGWYDCDKVRFRQGTPEKIGGWTRISNNTFLGVCRSLWAWSTIGGASILGIGTHLKFYLENGGIYYDITPLRVTPPATLAANPFSTVSGSTTVTVTDAAGGYETGAFVTFSGLTLSTVDITGTAGQFSCATSTLSLGMPIKISGALTGTGSITGYVNPTTYYIIATNGTTTFTLSDTLGGSAITTTAGTTAGLTFLKTVGGLNLTGEYQITVSPLTTGVYTIQAATPATSTATGGGASVVAAYQINPGSEIAIPLTGWGAGPWGSGGWGVGSESYTQIRIWNQNNWGQNLLFGPRGGGLYYWDSGTTLATRGELVSSISGASDVPLYQNGIIVSDTNRIALVFGTNDFGSTTLDPMLIRWSAAEDFTMWTPSLENQAGFVRLSHGSEIVAQVQSRQEILVWTDASLYSLQYLGPPLVWQTQLLGDNISIIGPNSAVIASGVTFWMGVDKFYKYDGRIQTLRCDLREFIFNDINKTQYDQIFAGTNEGFNEVWWFYCSAGSDEIDTYVIYNYEEDIWYYGNMARTAWLDSGLRSYPIAATYSENIVNHEQGVDDNTTTTTYPIEAYISSSEFDIGDGHNFGFVWRILPDITFRGSLATNPQAVMYLRPLQNSGSGYNNPESVAGSNSGTVTRTAVIPVEQFTGQINTRVRGRQMAFKIASTAQGVTWQLGAPRMDIRPDGRRGG